MAERGEPFPADWEPPSNFEERLATGLIPAPLYWRLRAWRERRRGEREIALLPFLADARRISIDAGANKGVYTYWLAKHSRHVHAFEPNPKIFRILKAGAGRAPGVTVSPVALSDARGRAVLRVPRTERGYSNQRATLHAEIPGRAYGELEVETRRLDDAGIGDVGFIKIDVEGHELAVLDGAAETIRRDRPVLLIEIEEIHNPIPIETALARVCDLGYAAFAMIRGTLTTIERFSPEAHHRTPADRADYVFNFIFLPLEGD
jgi:FkbM family methyltransferase